MFILFTSAVVAQNNTEVPEVNTNNATNSYNKISVSEPQQDTVKVLEQIELENASKKSKSVSKDYKGAATKAEAADAESIQTISTSFTYSKQQSSNQRTQRSPSAVQQKQMDYVVDQLEENSPESFEYNYFKYVAGNYDVSLI